MQPVFEIVTSSTASIVLAQKVCGCAGSSGRRSVRLWEALHKGTPWTCPANGTMGSNLTLWWMWTSREGVPPKKLAFNRSDNPYNVAERWATLVCGLPCALGKNMAVWLYVSVCRSRYCAKTGFHELHHKLAL